MATCIPPVNKAESSSSAEMRLYAALGAQLGDDYLVMHSVAWISKPPGESARDGEVDFLICHPQQGFLFIEVKGGRIDLDYTLRRWTSTDRNGAVHSIHNPFDQARRGKYAILEKLKETPLWQKLGISRFAIGHAVFVPDVGDGERLKGPDAPAEIIGDRNDLTALASWVDGAFRYWTSQPDNPRTNPIGLRGLDAARKIFARVVTTRPLLSARLEDEEHERISLTERQAIILDMLSRQRRVMVAGGAGTGKTLIAREKAVRAAEEGLSTLLVCFNRGLADHLREQCTGIANLEVATFHQLCRRWIEKAKVELGRDLIAEARRDYPGGNEYDHHQPIALAYAIDLFGPHYDAIVVDEAQDFGDEFWMPIELMLSDHDKALLYVFLDENQDIYGRSAAIPIPGEPMLLDKNCRNTNRIHGAAYRYYKGAAIEAPAIAGVDVELITATGTDRQTQAIALLVTRLVMEEKVKPHDIAVLLCDASTREAGERALAANSIPASAKWGRLEAYGVGSVTVDTVARFKGLERPVVILWGLDDCTPEKDRETLYVGMSRAKSLLFLCGEKAACHRLLSTAPN
ncbi:UvrD-helicase domain-containing protein [Rhizobium leguminosarum]|uniref:UvrD-helicase domain-containing protein n=1 Tax=Rhizobium leguminosarum TaxID=384 RepID=UPI003F94755C